MENKKINEFDLFKKIYDGDICYVDKPTVNKRCDELWGEIEEIKTNINDVALPEICNKYEELIDFLEIESFALGAKFMYDLCGEINLIRS